MQTAFSFPSDSLYQRKLKALKLYLSGAVTVEDDGWSVDGHTVTGYPPYLCDCPDYGNGINPCVHVIAAREFIKKRGE
jgi:hypothetical protein